MALFDQGIARYVGTGGPTVSADDVRTASSRAEANAAALAAAAGGYSSAVLPTFGFGGGGDSPGFLDRIEGIAMWGGLAVIAFVIMVVVLVGAFYLLPVRAALAAS